MKPARLVVTFAAVLLAAAGCSNPKSATPDPSPTPSDAPTEGPANQPHAWPNGLTMQVTAVQKMDPKLASEMKAGSTLVKVTVQLSNKGTAAVPLRNGFIAWKVLAGPNRQECPQDAGWSDTGDQIRTDLPQQVGAGQAVSAYDSAGVPTDLLGELAVQTGPALGDLEQWTFTGAQGLLK